MSWESREAYEQLGNAMDSKEDCIKALNYYAVHGSGSDNANDVSRLIWTTCYSSDTEDKIATCKELMAKNYREAYIQLSYMYQYGDGVDIDLDEAEELYYDGMEKESLLHRFTFCNCDFMWDKCDCDWDYYNKWDQINREKYGSNIHVIKAAKKIVSTYTNSDENAKLRQENDELRREIDRLRNK